MPVPAGAAAPVAAKAAGAGALISSPSKIKKKADAALEREAATARSHGPRRRSIAPDAAPSEEEILEHARFLGIDPAEEAELLWIARDALTAPVPDGWIELEDKDGFVYYYHAESDESTRAHPLLAHFAGLAQKALEGLPDAKRQRAFARRLLESSPAEALAALREQAGQEISPADVEAVAKFFAIDPRGEPHLMWLARRAAVEPLPPGWEEQQDGEGPLYRERRTGRTTRQHPSLHRLAAKVERYRPLRRAPPATSPALDSDREEYARAMEIAPWVPFLERGEGLAAAPRPFWHNFASGARTREAPDPAARRLAASRIAAAARGRAARRRAAALREEREHGEARRAATRIGPPRPASLCPAEQLQPDARAEAAWRGYAARVVLQHRRLVTSAAREELAAAAVQAAWRGLRARRAFRVERRRGPAALAIQCAWRRRRARRRRRALASEPPKSTRRSRRGEEGPTEADVEEYAGFLGIDPKGEAELLWIAREALTAPVPEGWAELEDRDGFVYYYHAETDESTRTHPLHEHYRETARRALEALPDARRQRAFARRLLESSPRSMARALREEAAGEHVSPADVALVCDYFGIDVHRDVHLVWLARRAAVEPLPPGWEEVQDERGAHYLERRTGKATRQHPALRRYTEKVARYRPLARMPGAEAGARDPLDSDRHHYVRAMEIAPWVPFAEGRSPLGGPARTYHLNFVTGARTYAPVEPAARRAAASVIGAAYRRLRVARASAALLEARRAERRAAAAGVLAAAWRAFAARAALRMARLLAAAAREERAVAAARGRRVEELAMAALRRADAEEPWGPRVPRRPEGEEEWPCGEDVETYARYMGIDPAGEASLLWIPRDALLAIMVPEGWSEHEDRDGCGFFYHRTADVARRTHPLHDFYLSQAARWRASAVVVQAAWRAAAARRALPRLLLERPLWLAARSIQACWRRRAPRAALRAARRRLAAAALLQAAVRARAARRLAVRRPRPRPFTSVPPAADAERALRSACGGARRCGCRRRRGARWRGAAGGAGARGGAGRGGGAGAGGVAATCGAAAARLARDELLCRVRVPAPPAPPRPAPDPAPQREEACAALLQAAARALFARRARPLAPASSSRAPDSGPAAAWRGARARRPFVGERGARAAARAERAAEVVQACARRALARRRRAGELLARRRAAERAAALRIQAAARSALARFKRFARSALARLRLRRHRAARAIQALARRAAARAERRALAAAPRSRRPSLLPRPSSAPPRPRLGHPLPPLVPREHASSLYPCRGVRPRTSPGPKPPAPPRATPGRRPSAPPPPGAQGGGPWSGAAVATAVSRLFGDFPAAGSAARALREPRRRLAASLRHEAAPQLAPGPTWLHDYGYLSPAARPRSAGPVPLVRPLA
eukprot:tig00020848_g14613.t1